MTLEEFENEINEIRVKNGWQIEIEFAGVYIVRVTSKTTQKLLGQTGVMGSLHGVLHVLKVPLHHKVWRGK